MSEAIEEMARVVEAAKSSPQFAASFKAIFGEDIKKIKEEDAKKRAKS